jgi:hypothetical protein
MIWIFSKTTLPRPAFIFKVISRKPISFIIHDIYIIKLFFVLSIVPDNKDENN